MKNLIEEIKKTINYFFDNNKQYLLKKNVSYFKMNAYNEEQTISELQKDYPKFIIKNIWRQTKI